MIESTYVSVPGAGRIFLPLQLGRHAHYAMTMWAPCKRPARAARRLLWTILSTLGPRVLPTTRIEGSSFEGLTDWESILDLIQTRFSPVGVAIYQPPQPDRQGCALLLVGKTGQFAFVKIRPANDYRLSREIDVLRALEGHDSEAWIPDLLDSGTQGSWRYAVTSPIPAILHSPSSGQPLPAVMNSLYPRLASVIGDPPTAGYRPMHGDLTPWNVRAIGDSQIAIFDWEDADWGPPGADLAYFEASSVAVGLSNGPVRASAEVAEFWRERLSARSIDGRREARLASGMLLALSER